MGAGPANVNNSLLGIPYRIAESLKLRLQSKPALLPLFYVVLAFLLRSQTFGKGELDHDISTYLVMANEWLKGHVPFVDYVDVKPPGIYALFALAIKIGGHLIYPVRIMGALFLAMGAWGFHRSADLLFRNFGASLTTGILFLLAVSAHKWGWAVNTEIFFVSLTGPALYFALRPAHWMLSAIWGGLLGLGFIIKYHIAFDALAIGILFLLYHRKHRSLLSLIGQAIIAFVSFLLPFSLIALWYRQHSYWAEFIEVTIGIPSRYANEVSAVGQLGFAAEFYLAFIPLLPLIFGAFTTFIRKDLWRTGLFLLIWTTSIWIAILLTGKSFFHYYVQAIPPLVFSVVFLAVNGRQKIAKIYLHWAPVFVMAGLIVIIILQNIQLRPYSMKGLMEMQRAMESYVQPGERMYIQQKNLLYFLLDQSPVERYVHNSLMFSEDHIHAFGIDLEEEAKRIRSAEPALMLLLVEQPAAFKQLSNGYTARDTFADHWILWSR